MRCAHHCATYSIAPSKGEAQRIHDVMFEVSRPIAEHAALELALFLRYLDDENGHALTGHDLSVVVWYP